MRNRTITKDIIPIYSYKEEDWQNCSLCHKKLFKVIDRKGSTIEVKCKCGSIEEIII